MLDRKNKKRIKDGLIDLFDLNMKHLCKIMFKG